MGLSRNEGNPGESVIRESNDSPHRLDRSAVGDLFGNAPIGIYIVQDGRFRYVNPRFLRESGYVEDKVLGKDPLSLVFPDDREMVRKNAVRMLKGESHVPYEYRFVTRRGEVVWILETVVSTSYGGKRAAIGYFMNVTERKRMEAQLMVTDRLASIGELVSGVAHELNNPLTSIIGFSDLLARREDIPQDIREDIDLINREARRAAQIVHDLLTFARRHEATRETVDIPRAVNVALSLRAYQQRINNVEVITRFAPDLPQVMGDSFQLQQVFMNLLINAEHFMIEAHKRGRLSITGERVSDVVRLSFADDGPGIPQENLRRIFTPFFTTKDVGKGTGLGLSICHGIVSEHGGRIYAESEPGQGATFIVELPAAYAWKGHQNDHS